MWKVRTEIYLHFTPSAIVPSFQYVARGKNCTFTMQNSSFSCHFVSFSTAAKKKIRTSYLLRLGGNAGVVKTCLYATYLCRSGHCCAAPLCNLPFVLLTLSGKHVLSTQKGLFYLQPSRRCILQAWKGPPIFCFDPKIRVLRRINNKPGGTTSLRGLLAHSIALRRIDHSNIQTYGKLAVSLLHHFLYFICKGNLASAYLQGCVCCDGSKFAASLGNAGYRKYEAVFPVS